MMPHRLHSFDQSLVSHRFHKLQIASTNAGKIAELRLGVRLWTEKNKESLEWTVQPVEGIDSLPPCIEDGDSFAANAQKKALHYSSFAEGWVLGDDSGLEVDALSCAPGIYSRRYAGPDATDFQNNCKLLQKMASIPTDKRTAHFVCVLVLARRGEIAAQFRGVAHGFILESPRGANGFGYDPLFLDLESRKTYAELPPKEKWQRGHRGQAMNAMLEWLANHSAWQKGAR